MFEVSNSERLRHGGLLSAWCEDLGRLLLLRHQKGRSEEKDSGMPAMHRGHAQTWLHDPWPSQHHLGYHHEDDVGGAFRQIPKRVSDIFIHA
ncbi:hypothetical protein CEXT_184191 [Caerostris extrusa]|uniref:Uncharacterized protein n=1 Tax=Caerostris extrusa TaxID=172846 RepID=A0AAV4S2A5_CAEEX|nr:hypothetical protein CEXT_184191 [Caerostris extrusa]